MYAYSIEFDSKNPMSDMYRMRIASQLEFEYLAVGVMDVIDPTRLLKSGNWHDSMEEFFIQSVFMQSVVHDINKRRDTIEAFCNLVKRLTHSQREQFISDNAVVMLQVCPATTFSSLVKVERSMVAYWLLDYYDGRDWLDFNENRKSEIGHTKGVVHFFSQSDLYLWALENADRYTAVSKVNGIITLAIEEGEIAPSEMFDALINAPLRNPLGENKSEDALETYRRYDMFSVVGYLQDKGSLLKDLKRRREELTVDLKKLNAVRNVFMKEENELTERIKRAKDEMRKLANRNADFSIDAKGARFYFLKTG